MKVYSSESVRNIALASHQGAGKTSLAEAMIFNSGGSTRIGTIAQGNTVSDFDEEEIRRGLSLSTSLIPLEVSDYKINVLDTPGYTDFQGEVKNALYMSDLALILVDGSAGVEVGTEVYWGFADEFHMPRMIIANKMDRDTARKPDAIIDELHHIFGVRFVPVQIPIGENAEFSGLVDLINMKVHHGTDLTADAIPASLEAEVLEARLKLVEAAAEADDGLLEKYLDSGQLSDDEILTGVKLALAKGTFVPVAFTSGTNNVGVSALVDLLVRISPSPKDRLPISGARLDGTQVALHANDTDPLTIYVFKTTADPYVGKVTYFRVVSGLLKADSRYHAHTRNEEERFGQLIVLRGKEQMNVDTLHAGDIGAVAKLAHTTTGDSLGDKALPIIVPPPTYPSPVFAVAVRPVSQADSPKMGPTLTRLCDEDATLQWRQEAATKETILEGMGDVHVDVAIKRAAHLGVHLETAVPKVPYRETISKKAAYEFRHKKQTGGAGQFAEVHMRVEPKPRGEGFEFSNEVVGGAISGSFIPSIEKGVRAVLDQGVIAGYPVVDARAVVFDGKEHPVDSKDIAFQIAGREAFKMAFLEAGPVLLEPIMKLKVIVPDSDMGATIGDLSTRRAQVLGTESMGGRTIITALAPLAEVQRYSNELRSFTQGRGVYNQEFSHYQQVPAHLTDHIIAQHKKEVEHES